MTKEEAEKILLQLVSELKLTEREREILKKAIQTLSKDATP